MMFITPPKVISEGTRLIEELRAKDIKTHIRLVSQPDMVDKVKTFLGDVRKSLGTIQQQISREVDMPTGAFDQGRVDTLRMQQRQLTSMQDTLLNLVGK